MLGEVLQQLGVIAVLVQRIVKFVKAVTGYTARVGEKVQKYVDIGLSVIFSSLICVGWGVNVLAAVGLYFPTSWGGSQTAYAIGSAVTGVIAALGSNILNDLLVLYESYKNRQVPPTP